MSKKFSFSYCLLQYMHNPWLKERMNVGVLLYAPDAKFLKLSVRGWDGRITAAYPDINKTAFTEDLRQIRRAVSVYHREHLERTTLFSNQPFFPPNSSSSSGNEAMQLASRIAFGLDSSYTWAGGGVGVCQDPNARLRALYERFVVPFDREKTNAPRSDEQVWSEFNKLIVARKLGKQIQSKPQIRTDLGPVKFHAGYQNGSFHAIQSLSFDLIDRDGIGAKAAKWSGFVQAVKEAKGLQNVVTQFVLGRPSNEALLPTYRSARSFLGNIAGSDNVVDEKDSGQFLDRIEADLRDHFQH